MWNALGALWGDRGQGQPKLAVNHSLFVVWTDDATHSGNPTYSMPLHSHWISLSPLGGGIVSILWITKLKLKKMTEPKG